MKCSWCGTEFEPRDHQKYCGCKCKYEHDMAFGNLSDRITRMAKRLGFELSESKNKIFNAKLMLFKKAYMRCPCAADDQNRYCGSPKCIEEINRIGKCHCGLFIKEIGKSE